MILNVSCYDINITIVGGSISIANESGEPINFDDILDSLDHQYAVLKNYAKGYKESTKFIKNMEDDLREDWAHCG